MIITTKIKFFSQIIAYERTRPLMRRNNDGWSNAYVMNTLQMLSDYLLETDLVFRYRI